MNKLLILIFTVACLSGLYPASFILASPAVRIGLTTCHAMDAEGNTVLGSASQVTTSSKNNNAVFVCKFTVEPPGRAIHFNAFDNPNATPEEPSECMDDTGTLTTLDWKETISASGRGTLICHFKD